MKLNFIYLLFIFIKRNEGKECTSELTSEGRLRKALFCNYNTKVRPVKHRENLTSIQLQLFPVKLSMYEDDEVMVFYGNLLLSWSDSFLKWDPREYEGIDFLSVSSSEIWVPGLSFDSWSESSYITLISDSTECHLTYGGEVYCFSRTHLETPCTPDLTYYPFDTQNCSLLLFPSGFVVTHMNFTLYEPLNGVELSMYKPNKAWELKDARAITQVKQLQLENETVSFPIVRSYFVLRRHSALDTVIYLVPGAVMASLCLLVFWMDTFYVSRITVAATVLVTDSFYCLFLGLELPPSGDKAPLIATFYRDSLVIACFSVTVTVLVRHLRLKTESPSRWLSDTLSKMESIHVVQVVLLGGGGVTKEEDSEEIIENSKKKSLAWETLANFIDRISFILCSLTYIILLLFYLP